MEYSLAIVSAVASIACKSGYPGGVAPNEVVGLGVSAGAWTAIRTTRQLVSFGCSNVSTVLILSPGNAERTACGTENLQINLVYQELWGLLWWPSG